MQNPQSDDSKIVNIYFTQLLVFIGNIFTLNCILGLPAKLIQLHSLSWLEKL